MQITQLYQLYLQHPYIATDTRNITAGSIFFALKGPRYNGNNFAQQALLSGAAYAVVDEKLQLEDSRIIQTENVLLTLQHLAEHHRKQFNIPFIAITGSNGKTTTKELVNAVLSSTYKTYTTEGNLNNHIGIPLTLLKIKSDAAFAVIEMGANHAKEIEGYCKYVQPTHGLITNFGKAHLEGFGSIEGVRKAKSELFDYLKVNNGAAFVNADDPFMVQFSAGIHKIITYGTKMADTTGVILNSASFLQIAIGENSSAVSLQTQLIGEYNLTNIVASVAIGKHFNVPDNKIKAAVENYVPNNSRSQMITKDSNTIILDAYNANPTSMIAAIENFAKMQGNNKIVFLGAMMELGTESKAEHCKIIDLLRQFNWSAVVLVGPQFKEIENPFVNLDTSAEAASWLKDQPVHHSHILIKGSRSMQMEKILD